MDKHATVYIWPNVTDERFTEIELDLIRAGYERKQRIEVNGIPLWRCK